MLYPLLAYVHLLAAVVWVGGMLFLPLVAMPVLRRSLPERYLSLLSAMGLRFRPVAWASIVVLVVSGILLLPARGIGLARLATSQFWASPLGNLLELKVLLVAIAVGTAALHDFVLGPLLLEALHSGADPAGAEVQHLRRRAGLVARLSALAALATVLVAVLLVRGLPG